MSNGESEQRTSMVQRGDSFDIGGSKSSNLPTDPNVVNILQNPSQLAQLLNINEEQAENLRAAIVGGGAGISAKFLSKHFGSPIAGAFGAFVAGIIADKLLKK